VRVSLLELATLGEDACQVGATPHRREDGQVEPLPAPVAPQQLLQPDADALGAVVVALGNALRGRLLLAEGVEELAEGQNGRFPRGAFAERARNLRQRYATLSQQHQPGFGPRSRAGTNPLERCAVTGACHPPSVVTRRPPRHALSTPPTPPPTPPDTAFTSPMPSSSAIERRLWVLFVEERHEPQTRHA
jgi:hypothetical protein